MTQEQFDDLIFALLTVGGCMLAAGIISNRPDLLKLDPDLADPTTQSEDTMGHRIAHAQTDALLRAFDRKTGWQRPSWSATPTPPAPATGGLPGVVGQVLGAVGGVLPKP